MLSLPEVVAALGGGGGQFHCRKGLQQEPECGSHGGGLDPPEPWTPEIKLNEVVHTKGLQMNRLKDAEQESKLESEQDKVGILATGLKGGKEVAPKNKKGNWVSDLSITFQARLHKFP